MLTPIELSKKQVEDVVNGTEMLLRYCYRSSVLDNMLEIVSGKIYSDAGKDDRDVDEILAIYSFFQEFDSTGSVIPPVEEISRRVAEQVAQELAIVTDSYNDDWRYPVFYLKNKAEEGKEEKA